jgi:Reverse transcriptase (RNA-dependent DNA polymerase)
VWAFLHTLGIGNTRNLFQSTVDLNNLNRHFSSPPISLDPTTKSDSLSYLSKLTPPDSSPFSFSPVSVETVRKSILSISTKAIGSDGITLNMTLLVLEDILPVFTHIINFSLSSSVFPEPWKKAFVIPLPKVSSPSSLSQFRPISILPVLSKVLESIVHKQLYSFLANNALLCPFQSGFRPSHSTVSVLLNVTEDIRYAMDNTKLTAIVLLDFSSAFNCVDFDILLGTLQSVNVSAPVIGWFRTYLFGRQQCVRVDDASSDWLYLPSGVPQGGVLSPLLFSIFINKVSSVISSSFHLYADDLQLYRHFALSEVADAVESLNRDLCAIQSWASNFGLVVNPSKSQAMIVGSARLRSRLDWSLVPELSYDGAVITYTDKAKNLGLVMDCHLTWSSHINELSRRLNFSVHSLKRLQYFLPYKTKILLAHALLLPILDYADVCYTNISEELMNKLERLQNLAIRFIFGLRKYDRISEYRSQLKWLSIRDRRNVHILTTLYKILKDPNSPAYLRSRFHLLPPPSRSRRSCITKTLELPASKSNFFFHSFTVRAVLLWNALPAVIQDSPSVFSFKSRLKSHYLSSQSPP